MMSSSLQSNSPEKERLFRILNQPADQPHSRESDIFADANDEEAIEPSINETIRESLQLSFVSSEDDFGLN